MDDKPQNVSGRIRDPARLGSRRTVGILELPQEPRRPPNHKVNRV